MACAGAGAAAVPVWFVWLAWVGGAFVARRVCFPLLRHLALCLRRPKDLRRYGDWAVVTGPTRGLGRAMAMELARRGLHLVLVDLDDADLQETSAAIRRAHPAVKTRTVLFDLATVGTPAGDAAMRRLREAVEGLDVGVLLNNAGVIRPGALYVHEAEAERLAAMVRVNAWGLTEVAAAVMPGMVARRRGAVLNVGSGSTVAVPSFPLYTVYSSTKRYVAALTRCLHAEYKPLGIDVQLQVPFYVATGMLSGEVKARMVFPQQVATAEAYARAAARWVGHGHLAVPGAAQQLQWFLAAFLPDCVHDWYRLRRHRMHRAVLWNLTT